MLLEGKSTRHSKGPDHMAKPIMYILKVTTVTGDEATMEHNLFARNGSQTRKPMWWWSYWMGLIGTGDALCEIRVEIDFLNKFHHLAKGLPVKLSECQQSCRCRSHSGIKGGTWEQLQTAVKSSNTHFTPTLAYQIRVRQLCSNIMDVKPTFSVGKRKQAFDGMIQKCISNRARSTSIWNVISLICWNMCKQTSR